MKKLTDFYCQGYFGRRYDLQDAEVIDESRYTITVRITQDGETNGEIVTATFTDPFVKEEVLEIIT